MPIEPRWLPAREAADYVGYDTEGFRRAVRRGTLPQATYRLGKQSPRWDRMALDRAMGAEDAGADIGEAVANVVEQIRREAEDRQEAARRRFMPNL
jgi:hypothetical protein